MKIISWNCNGAFRNKFTALESFKADLWVIPESESRQYLRQHNSPLATEQHLWCGNKPSKGLSVFAFNGHKIRMADFFNPDYRHILPVIVTPPDNHEFLLIAVWASRVKENPDWDYIGQMCHFMEHNRQHLPSQTIFMGDFNINMQWNSSFKKEHNYSRFLQLCTQENLISLYHHLSQESQGLETIPTSFFHRDPQRGFHIDYTFINKNLLPAVKNFTIHGTEWLPLSDHTILELELNLQSIR